VIQLGPLTVGRLDFGAPVTLNAPELDGYHVTVPTAGLVRTRHAGHEVVAGTSTGAIFGPGRAVQARYDAHSAELNMKISYAALEDELGALLGHPGEARSTFHRPSTSAAAPHRAGSGWCDCSASKAQTRAA
jgi:hypothetical protein